MKLDIIDKSVVFEAGGLLFYIDDKEPLYLKNSFKSKVVNGLVQKFKEEATVVNEENNVIEIYLKSSNQCNLRCSYCFRKVQNIEFKIEYIKEFVKNIVKKYKCEKVKIDLTGDSEPLMEIEKLKQIIDACNEIGVEEKVEFIYSLNSNGTNMNDEILNFLYSNSILFGFTVEGFSLKDYKRIYSDGNVAQNDVIENIKNFKLNENELFGISMTLTSEHNDFVKEYTNLLDLCSAISMRIVNTFDSTGVIEENLENWKNKYKELALYLLEQLKKKNYEYVSPILRSRDFFGTYIKAILFNVRRNQACLGGYKQVFLNYTGDIYVCSWGCGDDKYKIGSNLRLNDEKVKYYERFTVDEDKKCRECDVRYICGGECHIIRGENEDLDPWCKLKEYLIGLSYYIVDWLQNNDLEGIRILQKSISANNYSGTIEPYIKVIMEIFGITKIAKSANEIKNEVKCVNKGPKVEDFIDYLISNDIDADLVEKINYEDDDLYILHKIVDKYNVYELVEESKNTLLNKDINSIIRVKI